MKKMTEFVLMQGGNLGDSATIFAEARRRLSENGVVFTAVSRLYRSAAVDCVPGTPDFCDAAAAGVWGGSAEELLELCQQLEREAGRPKAHSSRESRTLDLDLILFGDEVISTPRLTVPHPRARLRRFVLEPMMEIVPERIFPDCGLSVRECWKNLTQND